MSQLSWICRKAPETTAKLLREEGVEPVAQDGRATYYDPRDALPVLFGVGEGLNPVAEKARLDAARADLAELDLRKKRGEVIESAEAEASWSKHIGAARARLRTVGKQMVVSVPGFTRAMAKRMQGYLDEAMHELAGDRPKRSRSRSGGRKSTESLAPPA